MNSAVWRRLGVACFIIPATLLAYQASVDPGVRGVRVPLIQEQARPSDRQVRLALPELSALRGSVPILTGRLSIGSSGRQRIRVWLGGVSRVDLVLAQGSSGGFALPLSEGTARALTSGAGGQHEIRVAGDTDDWRLTALAVANAYLALDGVVAVVPRQVMARAPALPVTALVLVTLGALAVSAGLGFRTAPVRTPHQIVAGLILLAIAAVVLVPITSDRRVLVTPLAFWTAIGLLALPALAHAGRTASRWAAALVASATRTWRRHPVTAERACVLAGLVAMAVTQPLFEVLRGSPEFFVARNTTAPTVVTVTAIIALGLPAVLVAVERALRRLSAPVATACFFTMVGALVALMIHPWLRRQDLAGPWTMAALAAGAGGALAVAAWRVTVLRQCLAALAPAVLVVPALFLGSADIRDSLTPPLSDVRAPALARTPPIVLVVFDEFPLHSLLDAGGGIDPVRFPHFAALARETTWFREATTVSSQTVWAVPALASGAYPVAPNAVPTLRYYPQNLFTLLADRYEMFVFGRFLQLCPPDTCHRDIEGPDDNPLQLLADVGVVWLHIVAPAPLAARLPPVVGDWLGFARAGRGRTAAGGRVVNSRREEFHRFLSTIDDRPARLYFLHSLLPHMPFEFVPSGHRYDAPDYQGREENGLPLFRRVGPEYADALHQRHLLQVGFVDTLVGQLVARLRQAGIYDQALVIVTADHGASHREGLPRRGLGDANMADILRVPLFIKFPNQREGVTRDGLVELVDILPTVADVLGVRLPRAVDGHSLAGPTAPPRTTRTFINRSFTRIARRDVTGWRPSSQASLARRMARFGVGAYDALYAVPGTSDLLGRPVEAFARRAGTLKIALAAPERLAAVDTSSDTWPLHVRGRVFGRTPQPFAVAVNGRVVATTRMYQELGASVFGTMIPESVVRPGRNDVEVFLVDRANGTTTLVSVIH